MKEDKLMHLPILIEQDEDGIFIVSCPSFQACHSYGKTVEEAMNNIREVIELCMEESPTKELNRFIGFRELEMKVA
ncbi:type II toxin-antitoxin system HicB family antitoxin [Flavobacterium filum]|uniref:type II toxin-antitoxin system HicB family antitoxin n=1 Tax=Flavobacterium filum TaxID=370974 RepID=UPI0023F3C5C4|nr:type II toxin-antitoxin system HicB family antitoxin [Flavobacterium filum]